MKDLYGKEIPQSVMDAYEVELNEFIKKMNNYKPNEGDYQDMDMFKHALSEWNKSYSMDMPNKPGYYRANND